MHLHRPRPPVALAISVAVLVVLAACGGGGAAAGRLIDSAAATDEDTDAEPGDVPGSTSANDTSVADNEVPTVEPTPSAVPTSVPTPTPTPFVRPPSPNGRTAPVVATGAEALADQVAAAEAGLRDDATSEQDRRDWGHVHQVAIRALGYRPEWDVDFFEALPPELRPTTLLHISARRALIDLSSGYSAADFIPAWEIIDPEPLEDLIAHYETAEAATGIDWEYLAAINLIETGMGRIRGLSSAGAQGPMQFLPTTWDEAGIGAGDINDPHDAIQAAARYLVRRGGPADMPGAIWGYNNSDDYVTAVEAYAELLRQDPDAYLAIYNWEIYFFTEAGDIWLPVGFIAEESVDLSDFLAANPWSAPDPGLRSG